MIGATNRPLEVLRGSGFFRDDFYYRLCSDLIEVPPLRQRLAEQPNEMRQLLAHVLENMLGGQAPDLVGKVEAVLQRDCGPNYEWPGNVREVEQAVRRILLTGQYKAWTRRPPAGIREELFGGIESESLDADGLLSRYCALLYRRSGNYEEVARRTNLDRRTVKRYIQQAGVSV